MTNRPLAIASLLMIAAALSAGRASASEVRASPFTGPPPELIAPDAGQTLPGSALGTPPYPQHPAGVEMEATRPGVDDLLRAYSTVTISAGGTTAVTAPSAALRAVIEEEYAAGRI